MLAPSAPRGSLQETGRDHLVGVDVVGRPHHRRRGELRDALHGYPSTSRASAMRPVTAAAAAVSGLARHVRPPAPWRPSRFRLLVLTASWPASSRSPFMAIQTAQRHPPHPAAASP